MTDDDESHNLGLGRRNDLKIWASGSPTEKFEIGIGKPPMS